MPSARATRQTPPGKLRKPRLGLVFDRERLFTELDGCATAPGTWIAGPPGMGKTTLVATYAAARDMLCIWLQLDAGDADPATFVHFLLAAAQQQTMRRPLRLPPPSADDLRDFPATLSRLFRRLVAVLGPAWMLVLDNSQELGSGSVVNAGLAAALKELPDGVRVVFISRVSPPDAYIRAVAGQQLRLIDERQLRFTNDDTQRLVALHGRHWRASDLRQATDGWAAAMILLLATRAELSLGDALRGDTARVQLFALFAGEVLAGMSPADAMALMRIAFLPSANVAMAVTISGMAHAGEMLAELARRSLFTERREGAPPVYTFHALFSEFLRARATRELPPPLLRELQVDAAQLLAAHGQADAAVAQLIAAQAWREALQLAIEQAGPFVAQGRTAMLLDTLKAIPEHHRERADAWYWLGFCELAVDPAQALGHFERAHRAYLAEGDLQGVFQTAAAAADAIISIGANLHAIEPWLLPLRAHAAAFLAQQDDETDLRVLPGLLAAFVHRETAHPLTAPLADRAERLLDRPMGASQRILLGTLAFYLLWTGQIQRLDRIIVKVDRLCAASDAAPGTLLRWYGVSVVIRALLGRVDEALVHAQRALALAELGPAQIRARAHLLLVLAAVAGRDRTLARTHLQHTAVLLDAGNAIDSTTYEFQRGLLMLLDADWTGADRQMRSAVASGQASGWPLREHIALLGQALASIQIGDLDAAQTTLRLVHAHSFHTVCRFHHWLAALIEAHLAERLGQRARALDALRRAFANGRECGFDFGPLPFVCGGMMPHLAALALEHDIDAGFARHIIARHRLAAPPDAGARWPWPVRIRTLGAFDITCDGAPAAATRKQSRKPLELLKLLVALAPAGGGPVPVERLCAALWPDAEGDAARNSFDNTLHRLRKLLGDEQRVQLLAGGLTLNTTTCHTDIAALGNCLTALDASRADDDARIGDTLALAHRGLALYRGDFLAGEDDMPDIIAARERIAARFARHMADAGARLEQAGRASEAVAIYQRVLELQPLAEDVCRHLIGCLISLGRRAEAFETYRRCRQQLSVLLSLRPAPETEALVDPIRNL